MSKGITFAKIAVAFVLLGVFFAAPPAAELMQQHGYWPIESAPVAAPSLPTVHAASKPLPRVRSPLKSRAKVSRGTTRRRPAESYDAYQVPAGTVLPGLLRATLDSSRVRVEDRVSALLRTSISQNRLELIPAASTIHGKVLDVIPASRWQPRGRIVVGFSFVEHGATRNRIAIAARPVIFEPVDVVGAGIPRRSIDVRVNAGEVLYITLAEPLVVRLPK
jgi:hypothetical protein